jgi:hypothetical protein
VLVSVDVAEDFAGLVSHASLEGAARGVVAVDRGLVHSRGVCSCGWRGRQHLFSAVAIHDAHVHSAQNRCRLAVPLVWPAA